LFQTRRMGNKIQNRGFFDRMKAAVGAFIENPSQAKITESSRKSANSGGSLEEKLGSKGKFSLGGAIWNFALRRMDKKMNESMTLINDILFNAANLLENDPRVVSVFGEMVKVESPVAAMQAAASGNQSGGNIGSINVMGNSKSEEYYINTTVSSPNHSQLSSSSSMNGQVSIHASVKKNGEIKIIKLDVMMPNGSNINVDVNGRSGGKGKKVERITTIDVNAR